MRRALHLGWVALAVATPLPVAAQILPKPTISPPTIYTPPASTTAGRYRITLSGFASAKETADRDSDGKKNEIYAAAAFVLWDRRDGHTISVPNVVRTIEYGDISGKNSGRLQAGSASRSGGIWGGNGPDYVPLGFNGQASIGAGSSDRLPLLIFEGGLSDGVEALLLAPSLWETDGQAVGFNNYSNTWKTGGVSKLLNTPAVQNQLTNPDIRGAVVPADATLLTMATAQNIFSGGIIGTYLLDTSTRSTENIDRPIGLDIYQNVDQYQDRLYVITHEKLVSLAVGAGITVAVPLAEPASDRLGGLYTAYLRIERIQ
jgi:hypothetical protein